MKMPSRPWYPPREPTPDIFGLARPTLLGRALENETEPAARVLRVETGVRNAFQAAIDHLGEAEARKLFKKTLQRPKRGLGSKIDPERDLVLLSAYDEKPDQPYAEIARQLEKDAEETGKRLGANAKAIAKQLTKLVKEREARRRAAAFEHRRWRMAMRNEPPTLLELAREK